MWDEAGEARFSSLCSSLSSPQFPLITMLVTLPLFTLLLPLPLHPRILSHAHILFPSLCPTSCTHMFAPSPSNAPMYINTEFPRSLPKCTCAASIPAQTHISPLQLLVRSCSSISSSQHSRTGRSVPQRSLPPPPPSPLPPQSPRFPAWERFLAWGRFPAQAHTPYHGRAQKVQIQVGVLEEEGGHKPPTLGCGARGQEQGRWGGQKAQQPS